jgi:hypothetical protein
MEEEGPDIFEGTTLDHIVTYDNLTKHQIIILSRSHYNYGFLFELAPTYTQIEPFLKKVLNTLSQSPSIRSKLPSTVIKNIGNALRYIKTLSSVAKELSPIFKVISLQGQKEEAISNRLLQVIGNLSGTKSNEDFIQRAFETVPKKVKRDLTSSIEEGGRLFEEYNKGHPSKKTKEEEEEEKRRKLIREYIEPQLAKVSDIELLIISTLKNTIELKPGTLDDLYEGLVEKMTKIGKLAEFVTHFKYNLEAEYKSIITGLNTGVFNIETPRTISIVVSRLLKISLDFRNDLDLIRKSYEMIEAYRVFVIGKITNLSCFIPLDYYFTVLMKMEGIQFRNHQILKNYLNAPGHTVDSKSRMDLMLDNSCKTVTHFMLGSMETINGKLELEKKIADVDSAKEYKKFLGVRHCKNIQFKSFDQILLTSALATISSFYVNNLTDIVAFIAENFKSVYFWDPKTGTTSTNDNLFQFFYNNVFAWTIDKNDTIEFQDVYESLITTYFHTIKKHKDLIYEVKVNINTYIRVSRLRTVEKLNINLMYNKVIRDFIVYTSKIDKKFIAPNSEKKIHKLVSFLNYKTETSAKTVTYIRWSCNFENVTLEYPIRAVDSTNMFDTILNTVIPENVVNRRRILSNILAKYFPNTLQKLGIDDISEWNLMKNHYITPFLAFAMLIEAESIGLLKELKVEEIEEAISQEIENLSLTKELGIESNITEDLEDLLKLETPKVTESTPAIIDPWSIIDESTVSKEFLESITVTTTPTETKIVIPPGSEEKVTVTTPENTKITIGENLSAGKMNAHIANNALFHWQ